MNWPIDPADVFFDVDDEIIIHACDRQTQCRAELSSFIFTRQLMSSLFNALCACELG